jgi:hypothetical protein
MYTLHALLHPTEAPHIHPEEPSGMLWFAVAVGLSAAIALYVATRGRARAAAVRSNHGGT